MDSKDLSTFDCSTSSSSNDTEAQQLVMRGNQIDDLEKKMRLNELNFKKRTIELENELRNEQRRAVELQDELMKNIKEQSDYELIKRMNTGLQEKLTEHENQILEQSHKEHTLNQQIRSLKDSLQQQQSHRVRQNPSTQTQSPYSSSSAQRLQGSSSNSRKKVLGANSPSLNAAVKGFEATTASSDCIMEHAEDEDSLSSIDKEDLIRAILDLKSEKEALEVEMSKIREGAIDAIMEKERIIMELREQGFEDVDGKAGLHLKIEEMRQDKDEWEELHRNVVENYERMLSELHVKLEAESHRFEERMLSMEGEINERMLTNFQLNLDSAKDVEKDLMSQLSTTEDRLRLVERSFADQAKVIAHMKESHALQAEEHAELKSSIALSKTFKERIGVLEREMVSAEKAAKKEVEAKTETIEKLTRRVNELLKNCVSFETESKRQLEALDAAHESIDRCSNEITVLQGKLNDANTNYDQEISSLKKKFAQEKKAWAAAAAVSAAGGIGQQQLSTEDSDRKGYLNRQSCLRSDIGSQADFDSCFDSPDVAAKKRLNNKCPENVESLPTEVLSTWSAASSTSQYIEIHETPQQQENSRDTIYSLNSESSSSCLPLREITSSVQSLKNYSAAGGAGLGIDGGNGRIPAGKQNAINIHALNSSVPQSKRHHQAFASKEQMVSQASKQEMDWLRTMNEKLSYASESYEAEIEKLSQELRAAYKSMQDYRRGLTEQIVASKERESALKCELESLKTHVYKIETHMITYKLQYEEDNCYLKEELRITEKISEENKVKVASLAQDKDYFQAKYKSVLAQYKSKKSKEASSHSYLRPDEQNRTDINLLRSSASHSNPRPLLSSNHIWAFEDRR